MSIGPLASRRRLDQREHAAARCRRRAPRPARPPARRSRVRRRSRGRRHESAEGPPRRKRRASARPMPPAAPVITMCLLDQLHTAYHTSTMRAVTFQAPGEVSVEERPEPELLDRRDAIVRIEATGVCGSDLHIYHGRVQIEPGFTIGHEYVGTVLAAGDGVTRVGRRRPRARLLPHRLRRLLVLPPRPLPPLRALAHLRARRDARLAAGHAGRDGARAERRPRAAQGPRGDEQRRRAVRRRRDGHRLSRGRRERACGPATSSPCSASARSGSARCRPPARVGAAHVFAIDTVPERLERGRSPSAPSRST